MVEVKKEEKAINIFELIITIEEERVKEAQETIYRELNLRTQVPGFRKGYAPRSILRRYIDPEHLRDSLVQKLVPSVFREVLEQEKGDIIGEPSLEILEAGEDQPLVFRSRYFVRPEIRLPNADSIEIRRYRLEIRDIDIERELKRLQESSGTWVAKTEGSIQNGDFVQVTVDGDKMTLIAGDTEHQKDSVLNQTVLGMKIGEEKTVTLPGEAGREEKSLQVHGVHERQLPEQDEEFLRRFGEDVTSLEVLKRRIRENLEDAAQTLVERRFRREAMVAYCRKAEVEVPEDLIEEGKTTRMNNFLEELKRDGMTLERYAELTSVDKSAMEESFRKMAAWDLKMAFVISKFSRENGLSVTDEELDAEILIMAKKFGKTEREVRKTLRENDRIDAIKENLLQAKMTDEIARRVVVRTAEETINLDQWKTLEDPEEGIFS